MQNIPPAVIAFWRDKDDEEGFNQYVPYRTLDDAQIAVCKYFENGGNDEGISVWIDPDLDQAEKTAFWEKVNSAGLSCVYRIYPGILMLATKP